MDRTFMQSLIAKYDLIDTGNGKLGIRNVTKAQNDNAIDTIKAHKAEILAYLAAEAELTRQSTAEREEKIAAIDGLEELEAAIADKERYAREFDEMMEDEYNDGAFSPKLPATDIAALRKRYPRAVAYLMAREWSHAYNDVKASAGAKALERIINGEDYTAAITDMETVWHAHTASHMWD